MPEPLSRQARVYVAGHRGLVGSAIWRRLEQEGFSDLVGRSSSELDLRDRGSVFAFMSKTRPAAVVMAAARVGGILANSTRPVEFLSDNLRIQVNVLDAAHAVGVDRLLFLGSSCAYPRLAPQPIPEEALGTGALESTNDAYAIAKIAGVLHVQAMRRQFGHRYVSAMPTNLYGPGDNFDRSTSHALPAIMRALHEACARRDPQVVLWGTGEPRREFLHVDDLARACVLLLDEYDEDLPINIGAGEDLSIRELAELMAEVVGYSGSLAWDHDKPDGTPRKLLDTARIRALGWKPEIELRDGVAATYEWFARSPR